MVTSIPPGFLSDQSTYADHFMDLAVWEPYIRKVCEQHGFGCWRVSPGLPGTYPTFLVETEPASNQLPPPPIVVKFFGPLFGGAVSFQIERAMGQFLGQQCLPIPSPAVLADGQLSPDWSFLVFEGVQGYSIGQLRQHLSAPAWEGIAAQMGSWMRALHRIPISELPIEVKRDSSTSWYGFESFLKSQHAHCYANHQRWNDLPSHLLSHLSGFLLPVEELLDNSTPPHLIHADLTGDHLLGWLLPGSPDQSGVSSLPQPTQAEWGDLAIIDWGDARIGNILYELVAVHVDLFKGDTHLLHICLEAYGLPDFYRHDFPRKALSMLLLHQFWMPAEFYAPYAAVPSLLELAQCLFGS